MQKSLAKNSFFNIIYTGGNILFPFLTSIYVSRVLLPAGVGEVATAQNIVSYFVTLAALGLPSYGVREFAKIREDKGKRNKLFTELFLLNMISTTASSIVFIILLVANGAFGGDWHLYVACALSIFFNYLNIDWLYQGLEEYGYITARSLLIKTISFIGILIFVRSRQDYILYALISSFGTGANYLFNVVHARTFVRFDFSEINIRRHVKSVIWIAVIIFLTSIYNKIDTTMLGFMATKESVGYYTYAQKTISIVVTMGNAITAALLPRLSFYYENDKNGFYKLLNKGFGVLCLSVIPLCVGLFLVSDHAVVFLYGEEFSPAALTIRLLCPIILIKSFGDLYCYQLAYSTRNERIIVPAAASASAINIMTNAVLIPSLLQNGAVIASVLSELITNAVQFIYLKKKVKYRISIKPLFQSLISCAAMAAGVLVIERLALSNSILLFWEVICGAVIYVLINVALKNELLFEAFAKMKNILRSKLHKG